MPKQLKSTVCKPSETKQNGPNSSSFFPHFSHFFSFQLHHPSLFAYAWADFFPDANLRSLRCPFGCGLAHWFLEAMKEKLDSKASEDNSKITNSIQRLSVNLDIKYLQYLKEHECSSCICHILYCVSMGQVRLLPRLSVQVTLVSVQHVLEPSVTKSVRQVHTETDRNP